MKRHTSIRTVTFLLLILLAYSLLGLMDFACECRLTSSFMYSTNSESLWQVLAVGAGIAIALQVYVTNATISHIPKGLDHPSALMRSKWLQMPTYFPSLIATGTILPTMDYLLGFLTKPDRQLGQWPAWEIISACSFALTIVALCMNAQGASMNTDIQSKDVDHHGPSENIIHEEVA